MIITAQSLASLQVGEKGVKLLQQLGALGEAEPAVTGVASRNRAKVLQHQPQQIFR